MRVCKFIFKYLKKYRKKVIMSIIVMAVLTALSSVPPYLMKKLVDVGIKERQINTVIILALIIIGIYIVYSLLNFVLSYLLTVIGEFTNLDIKKDIYKKTMLYPISFFSNKEKGYIAARASEVNSLKILFSSTTFKLILNILEFIVATVLLTRINPLFTLGVYCFLPVYFILIKIMMKKSTSIIGKNMEQVAKANGTIQQLLMGIEEIKIFNKEKEETNHINELNESITKLSIKQGIMMTFTAESILLICNVISVLVLLVSGIYITQGRMTMGDYFAFSGYLPKLLAPVQSLSSSLVGLQPAFKSFKRLTDFFGKDVEEDELLPNVEIVKGNLKFDNVSFKYPDSKDYVFESLSFDANSGAKILVSGDNGSGKTTILKLVMGLYDDYSGDILVDGINIKTINKFSLREQIGIVSQNVFLFSGTIKENILYSASNYSDQDIVYALKVSGLYNVFKNSGLNLQSNVGENGVLLSGGQRQMIAIARAVIKKAKILIFDEATSNLDKEKTQELYISMNEVFKDTTCIVVSHESDINLYFNKIINLNKIGEKGDNDEEKVHIRV